MTGFYWYSNELLNSAMVSCIFLLTVGCGIIYYPRVKLLAVRWGCLPRNVTYEITV